MKKFSVMRDLMKNFRVMGDWFTRTAALPPSIHVGRLMLLIAVVSTDTTSEADQTQMRVYFQEGLNGVNRQPSNGQKIIRQPSKTEYFNRQPSNERAKISRQISFIIFLKQFFIFFIFFFVFFLIFLKFYLKFCKKNLYFLLKFLLIFFKQFSFIFF